VSDGPANGDFGQLLDYIRGVRRFDFSAYKRSSLMRRIGKRMQEVRCDSYADYQDYLEVHQNEFAELFNTILINVTSFFRDAAAWDFLASEVVPCIASGKRMGEPIRVWSAGCASGEEAYSLAMLLSEVLGMDQLRARVKIYGTDADDGALIKARQATYSLRELDGVPADYVERYFDVANGGGGSVTFRPDLRRSVIFGRHDLAQDAPISRLDLLVCRNTLMYFNAETQQHILKRFNFALGADGFLFLGKAETLLAQSSLFEPVDLHLRVFSKRGSPERMHTVSVPRRGGDNPYEGPSVNDLALDDVRQPMVVIDLGGKVTFINSLARSVFKLRSTDVGVPIQNLEMSYRPLEVRSVIAEALNERRLAERKAVRSSDGEHHRVYDVAVSPLVRRDGTMLGASITFSDVTQFQQLKEELDQSNRELETASEELRSSNEELETTNEELETTNEELQSTVEELETSNEELQSANEELATTNEELQSTVEDLQVANQALLARTTELDRTNGYLEGILNELRLGIVVLDEDLVVRLWNRSAEDLWGLRTDEAAGRHFLTLDIGLPLKRIEGAIQRALADGGEPQETVAPARNRRGKDIECRVLAAPLPLGAVFGGVILLMEERHDGESGGTNR
jgi:two-component system, chemotaxis family, CheB/CheR fusion protein